MTLASVRLSKPVSDFYNLYTLTRATFSSALEIKSLLLVSIIWNLSQGPSLIDIEHRSIYYGDVRPNSSDHRIAGDSTNVHIPRIRLRSFEQFVKRFGVKVIFVSPAQ